MRSRMKISFLVIGPLTALAVLSVAVVLFLLNGDDPLSTPPKKPELKYYSLGSRLDQLVARIESGEITVRQAAEEAPIHKDESVAVTIYLSGNAEEVVSFLNDNGGDPRNVGEDYIEAYVPVLLLGKTSELSGVLRVREIVPPQGTNGGVTSQGVGEHGSPAWNEGGYNGQGIKVGVIDVGFEGFRGLMGTELPASVEARCYTLIDKHSPDLDHCELVSFAIGNIFSSYGDHGTMVAEAIIDVAPEASLYIANPYTRGDLRKTVDWMIEEGVSVINYSSGWLFGGPGDGTSPDSVDPLRTVDRAVEAGIVWVNAAGNEARRTWFWSGPYSDPDGNGYISFDGSSNDEDNGLQLRRGEVIIVQLRWEDSWGEATRDFDLVLVSEDTNRDVKPISTNWLTNWTVGRILINWVVSPISMGGASVSSEDTQSGHQGDVPHEWLVFAPLQDGEYAIRVVHRGGSEPKWIQLVVSPGILHDIEHHTRFGSIISPAESANPGMLAVGAAPWHNVSTIEDYSSRGPTPDGRVKPDIVGATCAESALAPLRGGRTGFCGTSQATPHVAGLVALVRQRFPNYSPQDVVEYLKGHTEQKGLEHPNNTWGHGFAKLPNPDGGCGRLLVDEGPNFGGWAEGCDSAVLGRGHARYYNLVLLSPAEVTVTLESGDADPYLYLRESYSWSGPALDENGDYGGTTSSQVRATLDAGAYTIEATTDSPGQTGSFTLTLAVLRGTPIPPQPGPDKIDGISGDRATLVALYNATGGPNWKNNKNWLTDKPLYLWDRVYTDPSGRVTQLHLWNNQLNGEIPAVLSNLTNLETLDLSENQLSGEIPRELGSLANLEWLALQDNQLSGPIPTQLARMSRLQYLDLELNELSGEIPRELGSLANLEWLALDHNQLSGEIPLELANLTNLRILWLGGNELSGEIPAQLGSLASLESLGLGANRLTGEIPLELANLTNLEQLMLLQNQLTGKIPAELGNLTNLTTLFLDHNQLSGEIPVELGGLHKLKFLQLHPNQLTGCIPSGLQDVKENDDLSGLELPFCTPPQRFK